MKLPQYKDKLTFWLELNPCLDSHLIFTLKSKNWLRMRLICLFKSMEVKT